MRRFLISARISLLAAAMSLSANAAPMNNGINLNGIALSGFQDVGIDVIAVEFP